MLRSRLAGKARRYRSLGKSVTCKHPRKKVRVAGNVEPRYVPGQRVGARESPLRGGAQAHDRALPQSGARGTKAAA